MADTTPEIAIVGGRGSGKSTVAITKEIRHSVKYPGIKEFLFRFSEKDCEQKLIPFYKEMCQEEGVSPEWESRESCFHFDNGSQTFIFGLRAVSAAQRYSKMRGLGVARILNDQSEELDLSVGSEIRLSLRQPGFPKQLTFVANPPDMHHFLPKQFPVGVETRFKNRKLYQLSLYQNKHFPLDSLRELEQAYPPSHPNYKTLILGQYGTSVTGETIYGNIFQRAQHVGQVVYDPSQPLLEAFDFGKLNPCWVVAQRPFSGGLHLLGGIIGFEMFLEDFIPIVEDYRRRWFLNLQRDQVKTCCTLSVSQESGSAMIQVEQLKTAGFRPTWTPGGNSPDMVLAMIERQAHYLRRRGSGGREMFRVNNAEDRWLRASSEGIEPSAFMAYAYEGGYAWDEHNISVGRNEIKQPKSDEWYEFAMRCVEAIELNFGVGQETPEQRAAREKAARERQMASSAPHGGPHSWLGY
jgi:hypothetical protein